MRLIDADALKKAITEHCRSEAECLNHFWYDENIVALIDNAPTVAKSCKELQEVANERSQGEWGKWVISEIRCPNCLEYFQTDCYSTKELNKCPNCGADMRGEHGNENV